MSARSDRPLTVHAAWVGSLGLVIAAGLVAFAAVAWLGRIRMRAANPAGGCRAATGLIAAKVAPAVGGELRCLPRRRRRRPVAWLGLAALSLATSGCVLLELINPAYESNGKTARFIFDEGIAYDPFGSQLLRALGPRFAAAAGNDFFTATYDVDPHDTQTVFTPSQNEAARLDQLTSAGFLAFRVPHAPPSYTVGSISAASAIFYYVDAATQRTVQSPITLSPRNELVGQVQAWFPIADGRSHWEVWGLPPGAHFPTPPVKYQDPQFSVRVTFSYPGMGFAPCAGCTVEVLASNGGRYVPPYVDTVQYQGFTGASQEAGLAQFSPCVPVRETLAAQVVLGQQFTVDHCLYNMDSSAHTFDLQMSSAQGWSYTYSLIPGGNTAAIQPLTSSQVTLPGRDAYPNNRVGIRATYTPPPATDPAVQEIFSITAVSTDRPTDVRATTQSYLFGPQFDPLEGAPSERPRVYLPALLRGSS